MQTYIVKYTNRVGRKEQEVVNANSITEAGIEIKKKYTDCVLTDILLVPQNPKNIVIFSQGDQIEVDPSTIYQH